MNMKKAVILSVFFLLIAVSCGEKPVVTERFIEVEAIDPWTGTIFKIKPGTQIDIKATGYISPNGVVQGTANGTKGPAYWVNYSVLKSAEHGALIGKIGENGKPFFVGENYSKKVTDTGYLYLGINDTNITDNSGVFEVTIKTVFSNDK
jgi:hypothetical protein